MTSIVWGRDPDEAYSNPYEHEAQAQFLRELDTLANSLRRLLNPRELKYPVREQTRELAVWMLRSDTASLILDTAALLGERRHRPTAIILREILETADTAYYFSLAGPPSNRDLKQWFQDRSPSHRAIRTWVRKHDGIGVAAEREKLYGILSKYSHRTYSGLIKSYSLGGGDRLVHDSWSPTNSLVLPQTIATLCCLLARLVIMFMDQLVACAVIDSARKHELLGAAMEPYSARRIF